MREVTVIDSLMGCGKTTYAIQMINDNPANRYIFITPYLSEVERIKAACSDAHFAEPQQEGRGKLGSFHKLLSQGRNIASTHSLFSMVTEETRELLRTYNYILILDEVMDVLKEQPLKRDDLPTILQSNLAHVDDEGYLVWEAADYQGRFDDIKAMASNRAIFVVNGILLLWTFPVSVFNCFEDIYVLTYLFPAQIQRYYFNMNNVQYKLWRVYKDGEKYAIKEHDGQPDDLSHLQIEIYEGTLNAIGDKPTALSKTWYLYSPKERLQALKNNTFNFFHNIAKSPSDKNLWTTFKDYESKLRGKGYTKGFAPSNARATNEYSNRDTVAYLCNKFFRPSVAGFFKSHGITVDQDSYALSELVQFLFRSAIRKGEIINVYIPSSRMRSQLRQWLAGNLTQTKC